VVAKKSSVQISQRYLPVRSAVPDAVAVPAAASPMAGAMPLTLKTITF
jgi:hypothetical protein